MVICAIHLFLFYNICIFLIYFSRLSSFILKNVDRNPILIFYFISYILDFFTQKSLFKDLFPIFIRNSIILLRIFFLSFLIFSYSSLLFNKQCFLSHIILLVTTLFYFVCLICALQCANLVKNNQRRAPMR